jgi:hypothetical protein
MKKQFILELEGMCPINMRFTTWAEDEEEAVKNIHNPSLLTLENQTKPDPRAIRGRVVVKERNTSFVKLIKNI